MARRATRRSIASPRRSARPWSPGRKTNVAFLKKLCEAEGFRAGQFDTGFIDRNLDALGGGRAAPSMRWPSSLPVRLISRSAKPTPWTMRAAGASRGIAARGTDDGFQLARPPAELRLRRWRAIEGAGVDDQDRLGRGWTVRALRRIAATSTTRPARSSRRATEVIRLRDGPTDAASRLHDPFAVDLEHMDEGGVVKAPMHGKVVAVFVKPGDRVEKGQRLAIVEAMKMEHALVAPATARSRRSRQRRARRSRRERGSS